MDVTTLLRDLAESPAPPTTVDIAHAAAAGRRRVHLRRFAAASSAALVTVAVLLGVGTYVGGTTALPAPPEPAASSSTAAPRPMPTAAPTAFDPMVQYAAFGWVPPGAQIVDTTTARDWLRLDLRYASAPAPEGSTASPGSDPGAVTLIVTTAGHGLDIGRPEEYAVAADAMPPGSPVDLVNGRPAETVMAFGYQPALRWEYAPGAWAMVLTTDLPGGDPLDVARRVAADIRFGVDGAVTLPFHPDALPSSLRPVEVHVSRVGEHWSAQVDYGVEQKLATGDWPLTILAVASTRESGDGAVLGDPTTTVDGHPARTAPLLDGGSALQLYNVNGVYLELTTHSAATTAQLQGGLVGLFRSLDLNPDPATWR